MERDFSSGTIYMNPPGAKTAVSMSPLRQYRTLEFAKQKLLTRPIHFNQFKNIKPKRSSRKMGFLDKKVIKDKVQSFIGRESEIVIFHNALQLYSKSIGDKHPYLFFIYGADGSDLHFFKNLEGIYPNLHS